MAITTGVAKSRARMESMDMTIVSKTVMTDVSAMRHFKVRARLARMPMSFNIPISPCL
ncbi:MAG: hypothetical protein AAB635_00760 [Patescibacteria group bacterium]